MSQTKAQLVSGTTAQDLTVDNINTTSINSGQTSGRKNLIINGAMQVAQRGTSSTVDGYGCIDRFRSNISGNDEAPTQSQVDVASGTSPYSLGFRKAFRMTNGNQTSGAGSTDVLCILYRMEAQDIANSGWNYTDSNSKITLSFWCKSSVAQVFYGYLRTKDGTEQLYPFQIGSLSADTWTKVTKTIPGNSNLQFDNDNAHGLDIEFLMYRGTDRTGSISLDAWGAYNSSIRVPDMTSTWYTTNDATFEITGVQLEVGSTATDFEHRSFAEELALCQRYFQTVGVGFIAACRGASSSQLLYSYTPTVNLRASPTVSTTNDGFHGSFGARSYRDGSGVSDSTSTPATASAYFQEINPTIHLSQTGFSVTDDRSAVIFINGGAITLSAEI
jgi:hypothetical protein